MKFFWIKLKSNKYFLGIKVDQFFDFFKVTSKQAKLNFAMIISTTNYFSIFLHSFSLKIVKKNLTLT